MYVFYVMSIMHLQWSGTTTSIALFMVHVRLVSSLPDWRMDLQYFRAHGCPGKAFIPISIGFLIPKCTVSARHRVSITATPLLCYRHISNWCYSKPVGTAEQVKIAPHWVQAWLDWSTFPSQQRWPWPGQFHLQTKVRLDLALWQQPAATRWAVPDRVSTSPPATPAFSPLFPPSSLRLRVGTGETTRLFHCATPLPSSSKHSQTSRWYYSSSLG
jgi:hypothetical protein